MGVKNQTPKPMAKKSPQGKPTPASMKKGGPQKSSPGFGKPTPKQQIQSAKTPQSSAKPPAKNFQTPKQALNFQTPKQTPGKGQTPKQIPGKGLTPKQTQPSGKKVTTPHPSKKPQQNASDDDDDDEDEFDSEDFDDEEMDSDDIDDESGSSDDQPKNGLTKKQVKQPAAAKKGLAPKNGAAASDDDEDDEDEDEFDDEEDDSDLESEEDDEEDESEDETPVKGKAAQMQKPGQQKPVATATAAVQKSQTAVSQKDKPQKVQLQQGKPVKRPAPEEESDDDEEEDEDDEDEEEEDEEDDDEETDEGESDEEEVPVKATKKGQEQQQKKAAKGQQQQPQKKQKANDGTAVPIPTMPTKLDKKVQEETLERKKARDNRSLFIKNLPKKVSDEEIKALSEDIISVGRKNKYTRYGWLLFANEQVCNKNYEKLKNAKIGQNEIFVDFCGDKSKSGQAKKVTADERVDALRLYVGNMPSKATEADVKKLFPTATAIRHNSERKFAFVSFETPEKARQAFESSKDAKISGFNVVVSYAKIISKVKKEKTDAVKKFAKDKASGKVVVRG